LVGLLLDFLQLYGQRLSLLLWFSPMFNLLGSPTCLLIQTRSSLHMLPSHQWCTP
jgi:hypothetical protein